MKKVLLFLLLLFSLFSYGQCPPDHVDIVINIETDNYPGETYWMVFAHQVYGINPGDTIAQVSAGYYTAANTHHYDTICLPPMQNYVVLLRDTYGDGLMSGGINVIECGTDTAWSFGGPFNTGYYTTLGWPTCGPGLPLGCTDASAQNYNPNAVLDDGSCTYPPCTGFLNTNAYEMCWGSQTAIQFEWESDITNPGCNVINLHAGDENGWSSTYGGFWPASNGWNGFALGVGNGQMPPNWSVEHYMVLEYVDGSLSDTIFYTPNPCIEGCMDSTAVAYNPWATIDNGSCSGTTCDVNTQYQITMEVTLDDWPSETSWIMNSAGVIGEAPQGTYTFNDIGQTYIYDFCVSNTAGFELILNDSYGDGIAGSTTGGTIDGNVVIFDCNGDTIWSLPDPNFGSVTYSGVQTGVACAAISDVFGCTDASYQEYNPLANIDDGSCTNLHTFGCTDSLAFNYDASATIMAIEPTCDYTLILEDDAGDGWGNSYLGVVQGTNNWTFTMGPGPYNQSFPLILDTDKPVKIYYFEVGGPQTPPEEVQFQTWHNSFTLTNANGVILLQEGTNPFANNGQGALQSFDTPFWTTYSAMPFCGDLCIPTVVGCMDSTALNYDPNANTPASCITIIYGCTNPLAFNYNPLANTDDNTCIPVVNGCMDSLAYNYNPNANTADACIYLGCTDQTACNYNYIANLDNGGCTYPAQYYDCFGVCLTDTDGDGVCDELEIPGCTDPLSINFNPNATDDDGTCIAIAYGCTDSTMWNYSATANADDGTCLPYVYGCTDPTMFNYDINANTDDSSCVPFIYGCMDISMFNYDPTANTDNGSCIPFIYGCIDSTMYNYDPTANTDNGTCEPFIYGCTDNTALNFDPLANTLDNSCCYIGGCTDSTALNYDPNACFDDNSCITTVVGCTDVSAYNYNPAANVSDSTACLYDAGCIGGPGNPYWLNDPCYAWVIDVDDYCCNTEWDAFCQDMYNYCEQGWPTNITENTGNSIIIYPNPTTGILTIDSRLDLDVEVYDIVGHLIKKAEKTKRIDMSNLKPGIYNISLIYNKARFNKRVIKQ